MLLYYISNPLGIMTTPTNRPFLESTPPITNLRVKLQFFLNDNAFLISNHTLSYNLSQDYNFDRLGKILNFKNTNDFHSYYDDRKENLYNSLMKYVKDDCYFRILLESTEHKNCSTSKLLATRNSFTYEDFDRVFFSQYENDDLFTGKFIIHLTKIPSGGNMLTNVPQFLQKRGIDIVLNDDNYCGQRCLALADARGVNGRKVLKKRPQAWSKRAIEIAVEIDVNDRMTFPDFDKWSDKRQKQVIILGAMFEVCYKTEVEYPEQIYLYYDSNIEHYHYIFDINSATNDVGRHHKWCNACHKSYRFSDGSFAKHKCVDNVCYFCKTNFGDKETKDNDFKNPCWLHCKSCNCLCPNATCQSKHELICKGNKYRCDKCKKYVDKSHAQDHKCGEKYCKLCDCHYSGDNHRCFISPLEKKEAIKGEVWCYDFEAYFDENNTHIVNKCIAMKLYSEEVFVCDTIEKFVDFALSKTNVTFIAHNGKAYDTWLVHKYLLIQTNKRPNKLILAGNKIMYMKIKSIRFVDSLNHIAQALDSFPKTFGLTELKKGFFPYIFNTKENFDYVGSIPDKHYFTPEQMSPSKYKEFNVWYDKQTGVYDFQKELFEYCKSDVMILKQAMENYIDNGIQLTGINPLNCPTVASYALKVFKTNYLQKNKISVLTKEEYDFTRRGFFGGRTEVFQLKASAKDIANGKFIKYQDIQSLYPTVQFFDDLPCGVPQWDETPIIYDMEYYLNSHFGYVECDVVCPTNLHIPVLPEKKDGKLMFDLMKKSKAVYSSVELLKAIECGYKITKVYRTLYFDRCNDLFKGYIQTFLKIKTECNGYEGDDIDDYIQRYYNHCGVMLDKNKIRVNKGMKL